MSRGLLHRFERFGDLADLQRAVAVSGELVRSTSVLPVDDRYSAVLGFIASI